MPVGSGVSSILGQWDSVFDRDDFSRSFQNLWSTKSSSRQLFNCFDWCGLDHHGIPCIMSRCIVWCLQVFLLRYLSSSYDMRILPAKRGARDNANYRIEGILKRSWLEKMCGTIPAVLVLCIDWSEELSQPEQELTEIQHCWTTLPIFS